MPQNKSDIRYSGEGIVSLANGSQSLDNVTLLTSGTVYNAMDILGIVTATGKYALLAPGAGDGTQNAAAINYNRVDATAGDVLKCAVVSRYAEVNARELNYYAYTGPQIITLTSQLKALGILIRPAV